MQGVPNIPGEKGAFRDGGIVDYHLSPFYEHITQGQGPHGLLRTGGSNK
jgi:hypothetical protein